MSLHGEEIKSEDQPLPTRFICAECDHEFGNRSTLKIHIRSIHLKEKRFKCNDCEFKTNIKESLTKHMRSHTNEKPFECNTCGKMFSSQSSLSFHKRSIHLKEKRYSCSICDYKSNQKSRMDEHEGTHSIVKFLVCKKCENQFENRKQLRNHLIS